MAEKIIMPLSRVLLLIFMIFCLCTVEAQNVEAQNNGIVKWREVKNKSQAFVFKLEYNRSLPPLVTANLSEYEFLFNEAIAPIGFRIMNFPNNVSIINVSLKVCSPNNHIVYSNHWKCKKDTWTHSIDLSSVIVFNETGIWKLKWFFEIKNNTEYKTIPIYRYIGKEKELDEDSDLKKFGKGAVFTCTERIVVYSLSEYAALLTAKSNEKVANAESKYIKLTEELLKWQRRATYAMIATAVATFGLAIATVWSTRKNKKREKKSLSPWFNIFAKRKRLKKF